MVRSDAGDAGFRSRCRRGADLSRGGAVTLVLDLGRDPQGGGSLSLQEDAEGRLVIRWREGGSVTAFALHPRTEAALLDTLRERTGEPRRIEVVVIDPDSSPLPSRFT